MLMTRRSRDRLIFNIGIPILVRWHLYNETAPRSSAHNFSCTMADWVLTLCVARSFAAMLCAIIHYKGFRYCTQGRVTHICVSKLIIIDSDNGLSLVGAIIWTIARILLIRPIGINFSEILIKIHEFLVKKMRLKMSSAKWRPFCLGQNVLTCPPSSSNKLSH